MGVPSIHGWQGFPWIAGIHRRHASATRCKDKAALALDPVSGAAGADFCHLGTPIKFAYANTAWQTQQLTLLALLTLSYVRSLLVRPYLLKHAPSYDSAREEEVSLPARTCSLPKLVHW